MVNSTLLNTLLTQYGTLEIKGKADNPEIIKYFDAMGLDGSRLKDETAWCSALINWAAMQCGLEHTGKLHARSWLDVGLEVTEPAMGDVVVFWRGSHDKDLIPGTNLYKGHVGVYIRMEGTPERGFVYVLGGNQNNMVNISPYDNHRVLGYRRLKKNEQ